MTAGSWRARLWSWRWLIAGLAVAFPLARLLPLNGQFHVDWYSHKWLAAYPGEYLRQHGSVPVVLNTTEQAGMPYPVFYGALFYPLMAVLTVWVHPDIAVRVVVVFVTWLQFRLVSRALVRIEVPPWISRGVACLVIWATYPATNLYNRSAIPEYVATALLTCTVATWFMLVHAPQASERRRLGLHVGLLFALTAGTHPITALYSLPIVGLLLVAAYAEHRGSAAFWGGMVKALAVPAVLVVAVLAPWLYALTAFNQYLAVNARREELPWFYVDSLDDWATRFSPIPYDSRTENTPVAEVPAAFLDAQVNIALLILILGWLVIFAWRSRGAAFGAVRSTVLALLAFGFFTWLSLSPSSFDLLPSLARMIQIAYRLITYENLALLLAVFMLAEFVRRRADRSLFTGTPLAAALLIGCLGLAAVGVVIKWDHASKIMQVQGPSQLRTKASERRRWVALPAGFNGATAYVTPALFTALSPIERTRVQDVQFPIEVGDRFGRPKALMMDIPSERWLGTNVHAFPWNIITIDGVAADQVRVDAWRLVVHVTEGTHAIRLRTVPDPIWRVLRVVSFAVLALWLAYAAYGGVAAWRRRRAAPAPSPSAA